MKFDGMCLHGVRPGESGDCTEPRLSNSVLCARHHAAVERGEERAPPLRSTPDYVAPSLFDYIQDGFNSEEEARECAKSGVLFFPYTPLQVTKLFPGKKEK